MRSPQEDGWSRWSAAKLKLLKNSNRVEITEHRCDQYVSQHSARNVLIFLGHRWRVWACLWIRRWEFRKSKEVKVWRVHPLGTININTSSGNLSYSLFRMSWFIWPCKTCLPFSGSSEKILVFNVVFHPLGSLNVWQISWKLGQQVRIQWPWTFCFRYILPEDNKVMTILTILPLGTMKTKQNCRDSFSKDQD